MGSSRISVYFLAAARVRWGPQTAGTAVAGGARGCCWIYARVAVDSNALQLAEAL